MGILTSDPWENAFIVIGLIFASAIGLALLIAIPYLAAKFGPGSTIKDFILTWAGFIPYVFFLAGPVIDAINTQYLYSKASLVGAASVLITSLLGSDKFAQTAKTVIGMFPALRTPGGAPGVPDTWNWWMLIVWLVIGVVIFLPMMIGKLAGWAWGASAGLAGLFVTTLLAGNGLLGDTVSGSAPTPNINLGATVPTVNPFLGGGITNNDVCVTPGLESLQTRFAPAGIILTTSILSSHMFESLDTGNNENAVVSGALLVLSFITEFGVLMSGGCIPKLKYTWAAPFISLALGTGAGATAYYTMKQTGLESFTSSSSEGGVFHPPEAPQKKAKKSTDTKIVVGEISQPVDDEDAFVCEAYKDGELVTSTIVE